MLAIPRGENAFHEWQKNFAAYAEAHKSEMKIPQEAVDALKQKSTAYGTAFDRAEDPNRGRMDIAARNDARDALEKEIRAFAKGFLYNPAVKDEDRRAMGITDPKEKTPSPVPSTYPEFEIDSSMIRRLTIHFRDNGSKSKAKPHRVHGAEIRWALSETPITNPSELAHSNFDTASPFTFEFTGGERGQTVYFCLRWENMRGEEGPWGEIGSAVIP